LYLTKKPPKLHNNQTNWEAFRNQIEENLLLNIPLETAKDIEEAIAEFTTVIQKAAWSETPDDKPQINIRNTHGKSWTKLRKYENSEEDGR
jgi:hypothetical protein